MRSRFHAVFAAVLAGWLGSLSGLAGAAGPEQSPSVGGASSAQPARPAGSAPAARDVGSQDGPDAGARLAGEPAVQHTVIEDGRMRIDELRVRGQLQKVTVDPKGRAPAYEILTGDGSRDLSEGVNTSRAGAGKRVWNVLRF